MGAVTKFKPGRGSANTLTLAGLILCDASRPHMVTVLGLKCYRNRMALLVVLHSEAVAQGCNWECTELEKRRDEASKTGLYGRSRSFGGPT